MRIVIGSDAEGMPLKETVKAYLIELGHEVVDKSEEPAADFVDSTLAVAHDLLENPDSLGFAFDLYGDGSYMAACKVKGMVACECSDERSAFMTRQHNNARLITMGSAVVGGRHRPRHRARVPLRALRRRTPPDPRGHAQQDGLAPAPEPIGLKEDQP